MKYLIFILIIICGHFGVAQDSVIVHDELQKVKTLDYWVYKDIIHDYPMYKSLNGKFKYPIDALVLYKDKVYISDMNSESFIHIGNINPNLQRNTFDLKVDGSSLPNFIMDAYTDSLVLIANSKNLNDTLVFFKPNSYLKGKNITHTIFSYRFIGNYKDNIKNNINVSIDGKLTGMESFKKWELGHINGTTEPKNKSWGGIIYFKSDNQKKGYYLINDYSNKSFSFYKYTRNKKGIYELFDKPDFIWFYD